jgi:hypothetical protein
MKDDELTARRTGAETVALEDVDCTPRPRFCESLEKFHARMRALGLERQALEREVALDNRRSALRWVTRDGVVCAGAEPTARHGEIVAYWTQCACGFHGLQVADPEVARREYDAHACTANDGDAIHRNYREPIDKRPPSTMIPALAEERARLGIALPGEVPIAPTTQTTTLDDFEQRVRLLETK